MPFEFSRILNIIYKRLWIVILLPIIAAATSAYVSFYKIKPSYEANCTLYVLFHSNNSTNGMTYNDVLMAESLVKDFKELVKSRTVLSKVISNLDMKNITPEALSNKIKVDLASESRVLTIRVNDSSPGLAAKIADNVGDVFMVNMKELTSYDSVKKVDNADIPTKPISPNKPINIFLAFFVGTIFAFGITFLMEYLDNTMKTPEEVESRLGLSVIGIIPEFKQK